MGAAVVPTTSRAVTVQRGRRRREFASNHKRKLGLIGVAIVALPSGVLVTLGGELAPRAAGRPVVYFDDLTLRCPLLKQISLLGRMEEGPRVQRDPG